MTAVQGLPVTYCPGVLDAHENTRDGRIDRWRWPVHAPAALAVAFWAASYSWILGLTPPTRWLAGSALAATCAGMVVSV